MHKVRTVAYCVIDIILVDLSPPPTTKDSCLARVGFDKTQRKIFRPTLNLVHPSQNPDIQRSPNVISFRQCSKACKISRY